VKLITLSNECYSALIARSKFPPTATREGDTWLVLFEDETLERLAEIALKGETYSDTILRICNILNSRGPN